jgi:hypothetical protein
MPDYNDRDDDLGDRRGRRDPDDRFDDDGRGSRGDRRDDPPRRKSNTLKIVLIVLGIFGVLCAGACGVGGYWLYNQAKAVIELADGFLTKVGTGDIAGAYAQTSSGFKAKYTQEQFAENMKKARLTEFQSVLWTGNQSNRQNNTGTGEMTGTATLKDGTTIPVTVRLAFDGKSWSVDEVTAGGTPAAK